MKLEITYYGMLAEFTTREKETIELTGNTVTDLIKVLFSKYPSLERKTFRFAQKNQLIEMNDKINAGQISMLPPFAGG